MSASHDCRVSEGDKETTAAELESLCFSSQVDYCKKPHHYNRRYGTMKQLGFLYFDLPHKQENRITV